MAKQLLRTYVFTPGVAGAGTIILPGNYTSNQLLLITNTASNVIIYNFANTGNTGTTGGFENVSFLVPSGNFYSVTGTPIVNKWFELV